MVSLFNKNTKTLIYEMDKFNTLCVKSSESVYSKRLKLQYNTSCSKQNN